MKIEEERHEKMEKPKFLNLNFLSSHILVLVPLQILFFGFIPLERHIIVVCHVNLPFATYTGTYMSIFTYLSQKRHGERTTKQSQKRLLRIISQPYLQRFCREETESDIVEK